MGKTCRELFSDIENTSIGDENEEVCGIAYRHDRVRPGDAFFCIIGSKSDGHAFAQDAIDRGARVLVVQRKVYLADASDVTEVIVSDTRKALANVANNYYGHPSESFDLVGITGTGGKTSLTYLVEHLVSASERRCGVVTTTGIRLLHKDEEERTILESPDIQGIFQEMKDASCEVVAMEISSLALDIERVWGSRFSVTAFSNLSQDHLDYHHDFESYFEAKAHLFSADYPAKRVVDIDDIWGKELLRRCSSAGDSIITTGFDTEALIHPVEIAYHRAHTDITLEVKGTRYEFSYPLVGRYHADNIMLAFGIGLQLGIPAQTIVGALSCVPPIPGRLEYVGLDAGNAEMGKGAAVYLDYIRTSHALKRAIECVKDITVGSVFVVCSCGDIADSGRQSVMAKAALAADRTFFTSGCPDASDMAPFFETLKAGEAGIWEHSEVEPDRRAAIARAIEAARAGDSILIVGIDQGNHRTPCEGTYGKDKRIVAEESARKASMNG